MVSRALTIATSDSGGGAGIQADLKAFAAAGVHGSSALVALTAQNTREVTAIYELPPDFIVAQLDAVFDDIGVDAAMVASSGAQLLEDDAVDALVGQLFPLATVVTPNLIEARALTRADGSPTELAERLFALGASAVIVTGGHGKSTAAHLFDGRKHIDIPAE